jgi:hypothetical protein
MPACDSEMTDPQSLLEHWRECVAKLHQADLGETNGPSVVEEKSTRLTAPES